MAYGAIGKRWPMVEQLTLEFHYLDDNFREFAKATLAWYPEHSAFLEIPCRERECVNGGFDLNDIAAKMIRQGEMESAGSLTCMGWQDRERIGKHRCLYKLKYTLHCEFQEDESGG